ncbi:MAG: OadG family protein [Clostridiales bacterium]|nr:OadG family protein [Clostridiales bacterium]
MLNNLLLSEYLDKLNMAGKIFIQGMLAIFIVLSIIIGAVFVINKLIALKVKKPAPLTVESRDEEDSEDGD